MVEIKVHSRKYIGLRALVEDEDYKWLNQYRWHVKKDHSTFYARAWINGKRILMHRLIMNTPAGMEVDHVNHNGLDNRRSNLRNCTHQRNGQNKRRQRGRSSRFKGVYWFKPTNKWAAQIQIDGKNKYLGLFDTEQGAASAYDEAAKQYFGEFAFVNKTERRMRGEVGNNGSSMDYKAVPRRLLPVENW